MIVRGWARRRPVGGDRALRHRGRSRIVLALLVVLVAAGVAACSDDRPGPEEAAGALAKSRGRVGALAPPRSALSAPPPP